MCVTFWEGCTSTWSPKHVLKKSASNCWNIVSQCLTLKVITQKHKLINNFFETFHNFSLSRIVAKNAIKTIGHYACKRGWWTKVFLFIHVALLMTCVIIWSVHVTLHASLNHSLNGMCEKTVIDTRSINHKKQFDIRFTAKTQTALTHNAHNALKGGKEFF